ncbi:MAG: hypothetical protein KatS3mg051_2074 [Anaerolineae bacterium]|nr:MAG: hypothetical protein KatS3mg051_2074 [Anaerolineae bacterium]
MTTSTLTRDAAYAALTPRLNARQHEYLDALRRVYSAGLVTRSGETIRDLTDMEAARLLGWERTSVNGRRNELVEMGLVSESQVRRCHVTGNQVTAWRTRDASHVGERPRHVHRPVTLQDKIEELRRELQHRDRVYPRLIARGTLSAEQAARQIEVLQAILADYERQVPRQAGLFDQPEETP